MDQKSTATCGKDAEHFGLHVRQLLTIQYFYLRNDTQLSNLRRYLYGPTNTYDVATELYGHALRIAAPSTTVGVQGYVFQSALKRLVLRPFKVPIQKMNIMDRFVSDIW
jgi:hypothetical protein